MVRWIAVLLVVVLPLAARAADNRYPQTVAAGALVGRKLLAPVEAQPVLGRIEAVEREPDGTIALRVRLGWLPWSRRSVQVKLDQVALLGPELALLDLTSAQLEALPDAPAEHPVPPDEAIRIGLVKPFH